ncbi:hypothetical protein J7F01_36965 [Streptomyces sp. ISL-22]|uniref:hypothetical protein n=1 Tax=unclassified Streptomyces TaxID=2593676 RepID=UPI001BE69DA2|nr:MULTISPECIES: hypothetical protein [unclassified Streptomyces]MBT2420728.1 hypothetical protein [Streptomyces sp. ISL-24]MBT2437642.1 hypothetical protein [Streptomyces sp. ISL-22]
MDDDIRITCLSCAAQWMRGGVRCAECGGQDIVHRPQAMTRHSRGTQLSIIGWRELPLCRGCDAEVLEKSISENTPVPSDYVAACLGAAKGPTATAPPQAGPATPAPSAPAPQSAPAATAKQAMVGKSSPVPRTSAHPRQARPKATPQPSTVPTVRQAIAAFMGESSGQADATAMLLLGTHLGSHTRLTVLEEDGAADRLAEWCLGHWGDGGDRAQRCLSTICRAVDFWGARGWLASDPAAGLR